MKLLLVLSSLLAASGVMAATSGKPEAFVVKEVRQSGNLMPPVSPRAVRSVLIVQVTTNGCTKADDFEVQVTDTAQFQEITLVRTRPDVCKGMSRKESFDLESTLLSPSYQKPIRVMNPLIVEERFVH